MCITFPVHMKIHSIKVSDNFCITSSFVIVIIHSITQLLQFLQQFCIIHSITHHYSSHPYSCTQLSIFSTHRPRHHPFLAFFHLPHTRTYLHESTFSCILLQPQWVVTATGQTSASVAAGTQELAVKLVSFSFHTACYMLMGLEERQFLWH